MFDYLYKRNAAAARHTELPLPSERLRYLEHLQAHGYSRRTLVMRAHYMLCIGEAFRWQLASKISSERITTVADQWIRSRRGSPRIKSGRASRTAFLSIARNWFGFLGILHSDCPGQSGVVELEAYARFMREERSLSNVTIRIRCCRVAEFFRLLDERGRDLSDLDWRDLDQILMVKARRDGLTRRSMQTYAYMLRGFLRYLETHGHCRPGLAESVRPVRVYRDEALPAGPPWNVVCQLLDAMRTDQHSAIRDHAIVTLFALYGLRVAEVRRLTLDDLDWERSLIRVYRTKQIARVEFYPMSGDTAAALAKYIRIVRPTTTRREVFLQLRAPYQPLGNSAYWQVVSRRLRPLGLSLKHTGPHALRHACATQLLARGMNMKEIGDFLGHRHPASTALYAKADIGSLRRVADIDLGRFL